MIAARGGDHAVLQLALAEVGEEVDAPAHLECPDRGVILVLYVRVEAQARAQQRMSVERRGGEMTAQHASRVQNVANGKAHEAAQDSRLGVSVPAYEQCSRW